MPCACGAGRGAVAPAHSPSECAEAWEKHLSKYPTIPGKGDKAPLRELCLCSIPSALRVRVWDWLVGPRCESKDGAQWSFEQLALRKCHQKTLTQIERDVGRTFPGDSLFQDAGGPDILQQILVAFCNARPHVGYCQGMNYVAAFIMRVCGKGETDLVYTIFERIADTHLATCYTPDLSQLPLDCLIFDDLLVCTLPRLASHFDGIDGGLESVLFYPKWHLTAYTMVLTDDTVARHTFDMFLLDGVSTLFRIGLALLSLFERELLEIHEQWRMLSFLQSIPDVLGDKLKSSHARWMDIVARIDVKPKIVRKLHKKLLPAFLQERERIMAKRGDGSDGVDRRDTTSRDELKGLVPTRYGSGFWRSRSRVRVAEP